MADRDNIKLENIDPDDIEGILVRLEKSFGIKYTGNAFNHAKTFGDICDIIETHINREHKDDCTTQQAFYRVRKAISQTLHIEESNILLESRLEDLFPRHDRRKKLKKFQQYLGIKLDLLRMKEWLIWILFSFFMLSLIAFFFDWKIAISGLVFSYVVSRIASLFSKELDIRTVRQLTEKLTRENYFEVRRKKGTINKNEIFKTIQDTFIADLELDKSLLTKDASLG